MSARVSGGRRRKSANQKQSQLFKLVPDASVTALLLLAAPAAANPLEYTAGPSIASSLPANGDPAGIRKWLAERGVVYGLEYTNDVLSNVRGGARRGDHRPGQAERHRDGRFRASSRAGTA